MACDLSLLPWLILFTIHWTVSLNPFPPEPQFPHVEHEAFWDYSDPLQLLILETGWKKVVLLFGFSLFTTNNIGNYDFVWWGLFFF